MKIAEALNNKEFMTKLYEYYVPLLYIKGEITKKQYEEMRKELNR